MAQQAKDRAGSNYGLSAVSCSSRSACTAVGNINQSLPLAESWNGTRWVMMAIPNPSGWSGSTLSGISCGSASSCVAVGEGFFKGRELTLAESRGGSRWANTTTLDPGLRSNSMSSVSCESPITCVAVGDYVVHQQTMALGESWNGRTWSVADVSSAPGDRDSVLSGVSCVSSTTSTPSSCSAVGSDVDANGIGLLLVDSRRGKSWSVGPPVDPAGIEPGQLQSVSCGSVSSCVGVGYYQVSSGSSYGLTELWDGKRWEVEGSPLPKHTYGVNLFGVSCPSVSGCMAVGLRGDTDPARTPLTLAEWWDGSKWSIKPTASPLGAVYSTLSAVSCSSLTSCTAVGNWVNSHDIVLTLAEQWNCHRWTLVRPLNRSAFGDQLNGVSCTSGTSCVAVGSYEREIGGSAPLVEQWNGTAWSVDKTATSPSQQELLGVSCVSSQACISVGDSDRGSLETLLVERWNGDSWAVQKGRRVLRGPRCTPVLSQCRAQRRDRVQRPDPT